MEAFGVQSLKPVIAPKQWHRVKLAVSTNTGLFTLAVDDKW